MIEVLLFNLQAGQGLLLGIVPESVGLLIFGAGLVGLTAGLRWLMARGEEDGSGDAEAEMRNQ
jgi:hypothetical protein